MRIAPLALALALTLSTATPVLAQQAPPIRVDDRVAPLAASLPDAARLARFDAFVAEVQKQFEVPGVAVAIVKDGQVVLARGYGVRELSKPERVDEHTLFAIASNTKAFTAAALNILQDDGKLKTTDRVIDHLPWFRMSDPYVTREMRIRDLLAHRSGLSLGAGDLLYWPTTTYSAREVAERLKDVPLTGGFREQYAYDNILFGVAGLVVEQVAGMSFKQFLQTRIWQPLGMTETRFNADDLKPGDNVAIGHARFDFKDLRPIRTPTTWHNVSGAGGVYASVHDLSKWMNALLAGGVIPGSGGKRLFSEARLREMWSVLTPIPVRPASIPELAPATPNFSGYGQGWFLSDYAGHKLVWHTGGWPGQVSRLTLLPDQGIGVVVLTNAEVGQAFNAITYEALDMMLGLTGHDWLKGQAAAFAKAQSNADEDWQKHVAARDRNSTPSLPLAKYAGTYRDPWYGDVIIRQGRNGLEMQFSRTAQLLGDLQHWQHDSFIVRWRDRSLNADAFVSFALDADGRIREVRMEPVSPLTDFSFDFQDLRLVPVDRR
ncbi:serine hydrolase [Thermomonas hydrothermalis]|uniref:CubicO group peptidase, beta-lactamase class C family n=1 Tax=Thermomonas hydrothermalis TaxID=213588 RepID=A0A1M4VXY1_9GAMM|nr:serine hydrolase [Thermomonas hydrothermalis]SHE73914.1 CubicO group peptidase, beta-lactamase class C family [Thermomonas hydrothermalis]